MKRSEVATRIAKIYPPLFRFLFTQSVRGHLPAFHQHWLAQVVAGDVFEGCGFPMRATPYRLHIPKQLRDVYFGYFNFLDHEPLTTKIFVNFLKPGDIVVDVGANIGHYTLLAASILGSSGHIHAVECSPETLSLLSDNIEKNHLQNVTLYPYAAAQERGTISLKVTAIGLSMFTPHANWPSVDGSGCCIEVQALPLDELISPPVNLVKIDAEGADLDVLKGMRRILDGSPSVSIIVEWAPPLLAEIGKDPVEIIDWLRGAGFSKLSVIDEASQRQLSVEEALRSFNSDSLPKDWVGDLLAQR